MAARWQWRVEAGCGVVGVGAVASPFCVRTSWPDVLSPSIRRDILFWGGGERGGGVEVMGLICVHHHHTYDVGNTQSDEYAVLRATHHGDQSGATFVTGYVRVRAFQREFLRIINFNIKIFKS